VHEATKQFAGQLSLSELLPSSQDSPGFSAPFPHSGGIVVEVVVDVELVATEDEVDEVVIELVELDVLLVVVEVEVDEVDVELVAIEDEVVELTVELDVLLLVVVAVVEVDDVVVVVEVGGGPPGHACRASWPSRTRRPHARPWRCASGPMVTSASGAARRAWTLAFRLAKTIAPATLTIGAGPSPTRPSVPPTLMRTSPATLRTTGAGPVATTAPLKPTRSPQTS
jgi:hypothetical protein